MGNSDPDCLGLVNPNWANRAWGVHGNDGLVDREDQQVKTKRKPRSVWVWVTNSGPIWNYDGCPDCSTTKPISLYLKPSHIGRFVEFREVMKPAKRKAKR